MYNFFVILGGHYSLLKSVYDRKNIRHNFKYYSYRRNIIYCNVLFTIIYYIRI